MENFISMLYESDSSYKRNREIFRTLFSTNTGNLYNYVEKPMNL